MKMEDKFVLKSMFGNMVEGKIIYASKTKVEFFLSNGKKCECYRDTGKPANVRNVYSVLPEHVDRLKDVGVDKKKSGKK